MSTPPALWSAVLLPPSPVHSTLHAQLLSLSLPRSPRRLPLTFLPLPSSPIPSPPVLTSTPPQLPSSTEPPPPPPPPNHIATFLSTLLNLTKRSFPTHHTSISPSSLYPSLMKSLSLPSPPSPQLQSSFLHSLYLLQKPDLLYSSLSSLLPFFNSPVSPATSTVLMTSLSNLSNSPEAAYSAFLSIKNPDAVAFGALIAVLCRAGRVEEALGVFDLMLERGLQPTARTCMCILKAYCVDGLIMDGCGMLRGSSRLWRVVPDTGNGLLPRPDVILYTVYIEGLCLVGDFDSVDQVLKQSEEKASTWKPNSVTYNVYISGLCRAGRFSDAFHEVGIMRKKRLQPTIETLNILFDCLCCNPSTLYKGKELLERSGELEWEVDSFFYNTLMSRLLEMDEPLKVLKPLTDMIKKGIKPDICSFTVLARGLCKLGKIKLAKFIITSPKTEADVTAYNTLLHEFLKLGELQQQKLLYLHMLDKNVYPNKFTFGLMIDCLCKEGNFVEAMNYVIGFFGKNRLIAPDLVFRLNERLVAYGRLDDILHLLGEISKKGFVLKPPLYSFLIKALCRKGLCKEEEFYKVSLILDFMLGIT